MREIFASWSIRKKLLLLLFVVFLPASGIIVQSGLEHRKNEIAVAENNAMLLVHSIAAQQEQIAVGIKQMLSTLAQLPEVQGMDAEGCNRLFSELLNQHPMYATIILVTPDGDLFAAPGPKRPDRVNLSDRKHIRDAIGSLDFSAGEYIVGRLSNLPAISYSYPVLDANKNLIAILVVGFKLDSYAEFMRKANLPEGYAMGISDINGVRLYRLPDSDAAPPGKPLPDEAFKYMRGNSDQGTFEKTGEDDIGRFYAFKRLRLRENIPPYFYIAVGMPKDRILQKANREMLKSLSILGISASIAMCLAWLFGNFTLVKPIKHLATATKQFADGLLDARTGLAHTPRRTGPVGEIL
jgi:two-component system, sensor histidine kinase